MDETAANPLLAAPHTPPAFDRIDASHVEPAIRGLVDELTSGLRALESSVEPTWSGLVEPLERLVEPLRLAWGHVTHLMSVLNADALRAAHEAVQPAVVEVFLALGQSRPLYDAAKELCARADAEGLDNAQRRIITKMVRDAELSGVGLDGAEKERFQAIQRELAELSTAFSNSVLDSTKAFGLTLRTKDDVDGLPQSLLQLAAQAAVDAGDAETADAENGPWRITLDYPSFGPFLQHSRSRAHRESVYRAYISRASEGDHDNGPRIERILALRREKAALLGFASFADLSLASKMAPDVAGVRQLLDELREKAWPAAQRDFADLTAFAHGHGHEGDLRHWDVAFWAERLREERFDLRDEELRPYFPLERVLHGLFALAERLFDVRVVAADGDVPVWHKDVRYFRILSADGAPRAAFYLDPYSRPAEKRGGAWMDECHARSRLFAAPGQGVRLPVAHLICNSTPPVGAIPSRMTFREVETLFHEFGHGLQHMLTTVDHESAAGISGVEWDAVELPSQFMENWCYHEPTLIGLTGHYETGEPLPRAMFEKIVAARTFRASSDTLRQLHFGYLDLALHHEFEPGGDESIVELQRRIGATTAVLPPLAEDRFLCSFGHIFAGGYAAGYYSYKWAEVLSADAFAAFEEAGLADEAAVRETGHRFRDTVLALGGSEHPMDVFRAFRGREPSTEALLAHTGLLNLEER
ncbi:MAG: M3 family metallopeptidase [Planctomycetota bacterium]|nr:M3 family metallopeptidase [Planctomycetota bacterium]